MKEKKSWVVFWLLLMVCLQVTTTYAGEEIEVVVNQTKQKVLASKVMVDDVVVPMSVPSYAVNSRILVPVRFVAEHIGAQVKWDELDRRVVIITLQKEIEFWINQAKMRINGQEKNLDQGSIPQISTFPNGEMRTMVPLRAIGEILDYDVSYDPDQKMGILKKKAGTGSSPSGPDPEDIIPQPGGGDTVHKAEVMISNGKLVLNLDGISNKKVKLSKLTEPNRVILDVEDTIFAPGKWEFLPIAYNNIDKIRVAQFQGGDHGSASITRVVFEVTALDKMEEVRYFYEDNALRIDIRSIEEMKMGLASLDENPNSNPDSTPNPPSVNPGPTITAPNQNPGPTITAPNQNPGPTITAPNQNPGPSIAPPTGPKTEWDWMADARLANMNLFPLPDTAGVFESNKLIHILIDPGHGGRDPGTISKNNKMEKDFALPASLKLRDELQNMGFVVHMTRETDHYPSLMERANMANSLKVDIFISMHANAAENKSGVHGIEVWYSGGKKMASYTALERSLAASVKDKMIAATGAVDRGIKTARHVVTINSKMAAILIESGFISNPMEEKLLYEDSYQNVLVRAIAIGVNDYVNSNRQLIASSKNSMIANQPLLPNIPQDTKRVRYKVNADALRIRQSPGLDAPSIGRVYEGEILTVEFGVEEIQKDGYTWLYTTDNSGHLSGWLAKEFLIQQ